MAVEASTPGYIFGGSTGISYEQLQKRRAVLEAMSARNSGNVPRNVGEGLAALGDALASRIESSRLNAAEAEMQKTQAGFNQTISSGYDEMLAPTGGGYGAPVGGVAGGGVASAAGPAPSDPGIFNTFIDTAKAGGVSNPYALAAVAATGQAESGYDPKNAFGNWSDPSQSGQAGTAGGIMSWRADRLAGLQKFAADNGDDPNRPSPATQAKFFVQEDPALIQRLNAASSVEEAQSLMNGAWKFAGYDQPGGEADRRLGLARGYLPRFQGGDGTQVASLDPSAGMGGAPAGDTPWLRYANQGATRSLPVSSNLAGALGFLPELGVTAEVFSGGQSSAEEGGPRTGSTRHDHGGAADVRFMRDGRKLDWSNPDDVPIFQEIVRRGRAAGLTGFGAGDGYMEPGSMHVGFGNPGVWGAGGKGANAPDWLRQAYEGGGTAPASQAPVQVASLDPSDGFASAYAPVRGGQAAVLPPGVEPAPGTGQVNAPPSGTTGGANGALVAALQTRQANRANDAGGSAPGLAPMAPPVAIGANPVPPQDPMAGLDPRTSPEARAALASGSFDGFASGGSVQQVAQELPPPSIPSAPSSGVAQVTGAIQQAAQARGVDPRQLLGIMNSPAATDGQKRVAAALLEQMQQRQQLVQEQRFKAAETAEQRRREDARFRVTDGREDERLAIERARFEREGNKPFQVGDALIDPTTRQPIYQAPQKPTGGMQEYNAYAADERAAGREPIGRLAYEQALRKSSAQTTTINTGNNSSKFIDKSDEAASTRFDDIIQAGGTASQTLGDVQQLADLGRQIGTGKGAQVKAALGPYAQALGFDIANLGDMEAYQGIISRMAPQMRPAGAGATSDFDARQFLASLPSLGNTPGGNQIITDTFTAVQQNKLQAAEIASQAYVPPEQGGITWQEAEKRIRALPNPYERFKTTQARGGDAAPRSDAPTGPEGATPIQRARNPKTGELLELRNGQWVAVQ